VFPRLAVGVIDLVGGSRPVIGDVKETLRPTQERYDIHPLSRWFTRYLSRKMRPYLLDYDLLQTVKIKPGSVALNLRTVTALSLPGRMQQGRPAYLNANKRPPFE
jgi:hypothetical protein